jgi:hypothetical protein
MFTVRLVNLPEVRTRHTRFVFDNDRMLGDASQIAGVQSVDHVQRYPEFKPRTGELQKAQRYSVRRLSSGRILTLSNSKPYANPIDKGASPHVIRARRAPYLHFYWAKMGCWFTGKQVNHPGNKPYKFAYRAWRSAYRVEGQELRHRMTALAAKF